MLLPSDLSFFDSLKKDRRRAFYERHKGIAVVMIFVVFLLPFIGVFVSGLSGVVWGVVISIFAYILTPYAILKLNG